MNKKSIFLIHPDPDIRDRLTAALTRSSFDVVSAASGSEAWARIDSAFEPRVVLAHLGPGDVDETWIGDRIRKSSRSFPVVVLAEDRRKALRRGFVDVIDYPFDDEEVVLVTRLTLERGESDSNLSGDLDKMPLTDLLQTSAAGGRSAHMVMRRQRLSGELWIRDGQVIDARLEDPARGRDLLGRDAVFEMVTWEHGSFTVDFGPVDAPERISDPTQHLLLEAVRRIDEARRRSAPGHAGLPDEPPPPTPEEKAAHHALLLLNITASWVSDHLLPKVLMERLEMARQQVLGNHPILQRLQVDPVTARVIYAQGALPTADEIPAMANGVAAWLRSFLAIVERAIPGRYNLERLAVLTGAHRKDLESLGFAEALGWSDSADAA